MEGRQLKQLAITEHKNYKNTKHRGSKIEKAIPVAVDVCVF
jgi:hypothetical protein